MPQVTVGRPFGKLDLGDEFGLEPGCVGFLGNEKWSLRQTGGAPIPHRICLDILKKVRNKYRRW
jgi:hypothetical protein